MAVAEQLRTQLNDGDWDGNCSDCDQECTNDDELDDGINNIDTNSFLR